MAEPGTLRMELSWRVFLVSYPSSRQQRTVEPEPANSARFKSAKPSWEEKKKCGRLQGGRCWATAATEGLTWGGLGGGEESSHHSPTDCCITRTQGQDPGSAAPTWQSKELTCGTKHPLCAVPGCTTASVPEMKGHCCL